MMPTQPQHLSRSQKRKLRRKKKKLLEKDLSEKKDQVILSKRNAPKVEKKKKGDEVEQKILTQDDFLTQKGDEVEQKILTQDDFLTQLEYKIYICMKKLKQTTQQNSPEIKQTLSSLKERKTVLENVSRLQQKISEQEQNAENDQKWLKKNAHLQFKNYFKSREQLLEERQKNVSEMTAELKILKKSAYLSKDFSLKEINQEISSLSLKHLTLKKASEKNSAKQEKLQKSLSFLKQHHLILDHFVDWLPKAHSHDKSGIIPESFDKIRGLREMTTGHLFQLLVDLYNLYVARAYIDINYPLNVYHFRGHSCHVKVDLNVICDCETDYLCFDPDSPEFCIKSPSFEDYDPSTPVDYTLKNFFKENRLFVTFDEENSSDNDEKNEYFDGKSSHFIGDVLMNNDTHNYKASDADIRHCKYSEWRVGREYECECSECHSEQDPYEWA